MSTKKGSGKPKLKLVKSSRPGRQRFYENPTQMSILMEKTTLEALTKRAAEVSKKLGVPVARNTLVVTTLKDAIEKWNAESSGS